jgi:hypothetical protein
MLGKNQTKVIVLKKAGSFCFHIMISSGKVLALFLNLLDGPGQAKSDREFCAHPGGRLQRIACLPQSITEHQTPLAQGQGLVDPASHPVSRCHPRAGDHCV